MRKGISGGLRHELRMLVSPCVSLVIAFFVIWTVLAIIGGLLFDVEFGWDSEWAGPIVAIGLLLCVGVAAFELAKQSGRTKSLRRSMDADLKAGMVEHLQLHFISAKRFQEPEHGGLIHFLLTDDNRVFVQYDHESQDLGVAGGDPLKSNYQARSEISIARAPSSRLILSQHSSGEPLELTLPIPLTAKPARWPESGEFCDTGWEELESSYAS